MASEYRSEHQKLYSTGLATAMMDNIIGEECFNQIKTRGYSAFPDTMSYDEYCDNVFNLLVQDLDMLTMIRSMFLYDNYALFIDIESCFNHNSCRETQIAAFYINLTSGKVVFCTET